MCRCHRGLLHHVLEPKGQHTGHIATKNPKHKWETQGGNTTSARMRSATPDTSPNQLTHIRQGVEDDSQKQLWSEEALYFDVLEST